MGFFKKFQLGKVLGSTFRGFAQGGFAGAVAQGGSQALVSTAAAASSRASRTAPMGSPQQFSGVQTQFMGGNAITVANRGAGAGLPAPRAISAGVSGDIFNALALLADKLGVVIRNPNSVIRVGRNLLAKLVRFSRATPGLTVLGMLVQLGITSLAANQLVAWYSTAGKRHKRIRVTNIKALKRSVRRLEGFRKLACRVEASLVARGASPARRRVAPCRSCRKSPCKC